MMARMKQLSDAGTALLDDPADASPLAAKSPLAARNPEPVTAQPTAPVDPLASALDAVSREAQSERDADLMEEAANWATYTAALRHPSDVDSERLKYAVQRLGIDKQHADDDARLLAKYLELRDRHVHLAE